MTKVRHIHRELKGDPIGKLASLRGLEGHLIRTKVLQAPWRDESTLVDKRLSKIRQAQLENGSWHNTIIDTTGQVGQLLLYGVSPRDKTVRRARKWLLTRQNTDHPVWAGLFVEPKRPRKSTPHGRRLQRQYARFHPHVAPDFCCGVNAVTSTCCVLETLFALGDDVSSNAALATAVNRILAMGNASGGVCAGYFARLRSDPASIRNGSLLWDAGTNRVFRRACETNPGVTICAHFLLRAIARSRDLAASALVQSTLAAWQAHQLDNGNFDTKYYQYSCYYALDTLRLFRNHSAAQAMVLKMLPALLRRQKRDGKWWTSENWILPTFSAVWTLHTFGLLE